MVRVSETANGRLGEVANGGFVEFRLEKIEFSGTVALEKAEWLFWVGCVSPSNPEADLRRIST